MPLGEVMGKCLVSCFLTHGVVRLVDAKTCRQVARNGQKQLMITLMMATSRIATAWLTPLLRGIGCIRPHENWTVVQTVSKVPSSLEIRTPFSMWFCSRLYRLLARLRSSGNSLVMYYNFMGNLRCCKFLIITCFLLFLFPYFPLFCLNWMPFL